MGAGASTSSPAEPSPGSRFASLPSTGRYAVVRVPGGGPVHVLGVVPASRLSAAEAGDLVRAVQPSVLYIDDSPELVAALAADVAAGHCGPGFAASLSETPRPFAWAPGAGLVGSVWLRKQLVDNEMFALLGACGPGARRRPACGSAGDALPAPPRAAQAPSSSPRKRRRW
jgi:hypothetical protein